MALYRPSELTCCLDKLNTHAKKSLSQNFLIDRNIIEKIIAAAEVSPNDCIVEIGPGPGALTEALLNTGCRVIAIEKDTIFANNLKPHEKLFVTCDDILKTPLDQLISPYLAEGQKAKVVANIPYSLTSSLLEMLAPMNHLFSTLTLMVQEEVAQRCTTSHGNRNYSSLTVFLNYYSNVKYQFKVKRTCFIPQPKVDSAVITLYLEPSKTVSSPEDFLMMVKKAFQQRRKTVASSLRPILPPEITRNVLNEINKSEKARPEELSLEDFFHLYEKMIAIHPTGYLPILRP